MKRIAIPAVLAAILFLWPWSIRFDAGHLHCHWDSPVYWQRTTRQMGCATELAICWRRSNPQPWEGAYEVLRISWHPRGGWWISVANRRIVKQ